jgi:hypothetical protein
VTVAITAGAVQAAAGQIADLMAAVQARAASLPADEQVAEDVLGDLALLGVPYAGAIAAIIPLIGWAVTHNESATPGALVPIASGDRGSDPFRNEAYAGG